jgi:hypothetical protein
MATVLPPPSKRQRLETSEKTRIKAEADEIPEGLGSVRVQFIDQSTGKGTGPTVAVSVTNATVMNLETLLNSIQGNVGNRVSCRNSSGLNATRTRMKEFPTDFPSSPQSQSLRMARLSSTFFQIFTTQF